MPKLAKEYGIDIKVKSNKPNSLKEKSNIDLELLHDHKSMKNICFAFDNRSIDDLEKEILKIINSDLLTKDEKKDMRKRKIEVAKKFFGQRIFNQEFS